MSEFPHYKVRPYSDNDGNIHDIEFLPCPFCGEMPYVMSKGNMNTKKRSVIVKCGGCLVKRETGAIRHGFKWCYEKAAEVWNQRVPYAKTQNAKNRSDWVDPDDCELAGN